MYRYLCKRSIFSLVIIVLTFLFIGSFFSQVRSRTLPGVTESITVKSPDHISSSRQHISIDDNWRFFKYDSIPDADDLIYDTRPDIDADDDEMSGSAKTDTVRTSKIVLKPWIMPSGNDFIKNPKKRYPRPNGNPGGNCPFVQSDFDDSNWQHVNLPHDWAIAGPFFEGSHPKVGGGMGRLPSPGVAWYRKQIFIPVADTNKSVFLDVDGAMSYAMVWVNGNLVGGWPYGYASWRLNLTPYILTGQKNQLAIRLDNPPESARWYPGGGIYRNVWLTTTNQVHVGHWGTFIRTPSVSKDNAIVGLTITIDNDSRDPTPVRVATELFTLDEENNTGGEAVAAFQPKETLVLAQNRVTIRDSLVITNPKLWGPPPTQVPNRYMAVTKLWQDDRIIDQYKTVFGICDIQFKPDSGLFVNGEYIKIKGVNLHHDLGALGAAFNIRAAERQLKMLQEMGCNAIRTAHNPPAPEFLELTDRMGFLVHDEIFDVWKRKKTPLDFHLIFPDWHEQDLRAFIRRDRNHPSVIIWSFGNEVGEQFTGEDGAAIGAQLHQIVRQEDPTRPATASMNFAKPDMPFSENMDLISLNYQGEGIRNAPAYSHLKGITTPPLYSDFHKKFPDEVILSSENAAALSSRGTYLFPVSDGTSAPVSDSLGGDSENRYVSAYELYTTAFGSSADKVFATLDKDPYVAGGFVWSGWDYLGEPTPYYQSRSSYFGIVDLAGFKKDRFYLYQSHWRPDFPMAHILPHWNWPDRLGKVTPVHVFTSGDEAELFLNGKSLGRKKKGKNEYRLRWDRVKYEPGELKVVAYKNGKRWAEDIVKTTGEPTGLDLSVDRDTIRADGKDLAFVTARVLDQDGLTVPIAMNGIKFEVNGPGEIIATDNGDPTDMTPFPSQRRRAFNGLVLAIVRSKKGESGIITVTAKSPSLKPSVISIKSYK